MNGWLVELCRSVTVLAADLLWSGEASAFITELPFTASTGISQACSTEMKSCNLLLFPFLRPLDHTPFFKMTTPDLIVPGWSPIMCNSSRSEISHGQLTLPTLVEYIWDELGRQVRSANPMPNNIDQMWQLLQQEWVAIPQRTFQTLVHSMRQRCIECLAANGGHTRY